VKIIMVVIVLWSNLSGMSLISLLAAADVRETLYAAFAAKVGGNAKSTLYQWSLPEGNARHVPEMVSGTCMTTSCGRHFGLLGSWSLLVEV
jgi:hypothetical protein